MPGRVCRGACGCIGWPLGRGGANDGRGATAEDDERGGAGGAPALGFSGSLIETRLPRATGPPALPL